MEDYIIVNATALDRSGALSILRQFVENIPVDSRKWLLFVSPEVSLSTDNPNVRIEPIEGVKPMRRRLLWDVFGIRKWLKRKRINPVGAVSLQNTGFRVGSRVPSYIYYHQPIPFFQFRWVPFKRQERTFWFYKNIYPFFVRLFLKKDTKIFVQLDFIKKGFENCFGHCPDFVKVYCPSVSNPETKSVDKVEQSDSLKLLYPAMPYFYKNHQVIAEALRQTDREVEILFTFDSCVQTYEDTRIRPIGMQPYERICQLYHSCDALLFPSYIETFGLPLLEAAMTGMPIIAADLPYAREVLAGYDGVQFVEYDKPECWAKAIDNLKKGKRYEPINISERSGWKELFEEITTAL